MNEKELVMGQTESKRETHLQNTRSRFEQDPKARRVPMRKKQIQGLLQN
jgi:hypothetical protein